MNRVAEAAASGDRRATLEALRDHLAEALDAGGPGLSAQIAGQLRQCLADLDALGPTDAPDKVDELLERRAARRLIQS